MVVYYALPEFPKKNGIFYVLKTPENGSPRIVPFFFGDRIVPFCTLRLVLASGTKNMFLFHQI